MYQLNGLLQGASRAHCHRHIAVLLTPICPSSLTCPESVWSQQKQSHPQSPLQMLLQPRLHLQSIQRQIMQSLRVLQHSLRTALVPT